MQKLRLAVNHFHYVRLAADFYHITYAHAEVVCSDFSNACILYVCADPSFAKDRCKKCWVAVVLNNLSVRGWRLQFPHKPRIMIQM
eukprot:COSAG05_NODE_4531_length_1475_cov_23.828488_2_plen_86_part_00